MNESAGRARTAIERYLSAVGGWDIDGRLGSTAPPIASSPMARASPPAWRRELARGFGLDWVAARTGAPYRTAREACS